MWSVLYIIYFCLFNICIMILAVSSTALWDTSITLHPIFSTRLSKYANSSSILFIVAYVAWLPNPSAFNLSFRILSLRSDVSFSFSVQAPDSFRESFSALRHFQFSFYDQWEVQNSFFTLELLGGRKDSADSIVEQPALGSTLIRTEPFVADPK